MQSDAIDITAMPSLRQENVLLTGQKRVLEMIATGAPLEDTLTELTHFIEAQEEGLRCGILIVSDDGKHFRRGVGPTLPEVYHRTLDGVPITPPYIGSCGEAAHAGRPIFVEDVANHEAYSEEWRKLVLSCGLKACCSLPVRASDGRVLASFAMYHPHPRDPHPAYPDLIEIATHLAGIALERQLAVAALRTSETRQAKELAATRRLHEISTQLIREDEPDALYRQLLDAAMGIMRSDAASVQMLHRDRNELRLLASKGFHPASAEFWEWVRADSGSTCGAALAAGERIVAEDVEACEFMAGTADLEAYRRSGIRAVQSTPLVSRSGEPLGMISTHWYAPHSPAEHELRLLDVLARQAAELIERVQSEAHRKLLLLEVNHRAKNMLHTVQSIAVQTRHHAASPGAFEKVFLARLTSLSHTHDLLSKGSWQGASLKDLIATELAPYEGSGEPHWTLEGDHVQLHAKTALALGMAIHELATNAAKYGALTTPAGRIDISWRTAGSLCIDWIEHDGPPVQKPPQRGFGSRLIEHGLTYELEADVRLAFEPGGVHCTIDIPLTPATSDQRPATSDQRPATSDQRPASLTWKDDESRNRQPVGPAHPYC